MQYQSIGQWPLGALAVWSAFPVAAQAAGTLVVSGGALCSPIRTSLGTALVALTTQGAASATKNATALGDVTISGTASGTTCPLGAASGNILVTAMGKTGTVVSATGSGTMTVSGTCRTAPAASGSVLLTASGTSIKYAGATGLGELSIFGTAAASVIRRAAALGAMALTGTARGEDFRNGGISLEVKPRELDPSLPVVVTPTLSAGIEIPIKPSEPPTN